jgi:hypothetical protein
MRQGNSGFLLMRSRFYPDMFRQVVAIFRGRRCLIIYSSNVCVVGIYCTILLCIPCTVPNKISGRQLRQRVKISVSGTDSVPIFRVAFKNLHALTLLSAREDIAEFCRRDGFKTYQIQPYTTRIRFFR